MHTLEDDPHEETTFIGDKVPLIEGAFVGGGKDFVLKSLCTIDNRISASVW